MKGRTAFALASILFISLACNCQAIRLPFPSPLSGPAPAQTPGNRQTETLVPAPSVPPGEAPFNISWDDRSLFRKRLSSSYQDVLDHLPGASVYHLAFNLSDPPTSITGREEVRYTNQEKDALKEVDFAIYPEILGGSIHVTQVFLNNLPVTPVFSAGLMRVPLNVSLAPGHSVIIRMNFSITVPTQGEDYYYGIYGYNDGILSLAQAYPTILVYDEHGWNNQTPDLIGDPLFSDTSFYLVSIDAPANLQLVASGLEVNRQKSGDRQKVLFADGPARDFYLAASAGFEKHSEKAGQITYNSFTRNSETQFAGSALAIARTPMEDFSDRYGPYPYTEFDIVPIKTTAGGVEFPGMTAIAEEDYIQNETLEGVLAHEVAHQWFYNLVGNETQQQPWLDESTAQFVTWQYFLDQYGDQGAQAALNAMKSRWDEINDQKIPIGKPVSAYNGESYSGIIYGRGLLFFIALRQQIGQETFDKLMHDYIASFAWDIATTASFKKLAEKDCNCSLDALFVEWVNP